IGVASAVLTATIVDAGLMMPLAASAAGIRFGRAMNSLVPGLAIGVFIGGGLAVAIFLRSEEGVPLHWSGMALAFTAWVAMGVFLRKYLLPREIRSATGMVAKRGLAL